MQKKNVTLSEPLNQAKSIIEPVHTLEGHESLISSCSFSKDGRLVVSSSADGTVRLWHARSGDQLASFEGHDGTMIQSCAFVPQQKKMESKVSSMEEDNGTDGYSTQDSEDDDDDGQPLIISASDEDIKLWGALDGKEKAHMIVESDGFLQGFALAPNGKKIISNMDDQCIILSTIGDNSAVSLEGHEGAAKSFSFSNDSKKVLTSSTDGSVKIWCSETGRELLDFSGHTASVWKAVYSPTNNQVLSCSADKSVRLWESETGNEEAIFEGHKSPVHTCCFAPNGAWAASASRDREIRVWDTVNKKQVAVLRGHRNFIWSIQFSPDSMLLLSTSNEGAMLLWSMPHGELLGSLSGHEEGVKSCCFSPRGNALASASHDNTLMLWNISGYFHESYVNEMANFLDARTKNRFPISVCLIMAEYAWPACIEELNLESEYLPEKDINSNEEFRPIPKRRIKSCNF
mmetsp:Transcript_13756/g.20770  ORF Transcript_13756/g.20770 Transcript_13756/m.20770 type:complete len:460 (-) Transcript_13756:160-1539(-)